VLILLFASITIVGFFEISKISKLHHYNIEHFKNLIELKE